MRHHTALLIIDMISCWDFPDADRLLPEARRITRPIAALAARCRRASVPVVYANDNRGQWRSDFAALVEASLAAGGAPREITEALRPDPHDFFVLKPKQSAFFGTPLELLLQHLDVGRLILTGVSSDQCVLTSAIEARMRDLDVVVPRDCSATQTVGRHAAVVRQLRETHKVPVVTGSRILLQQSGRRAVSRVTTTDRE